MNERERAEALLRRYYDAFNQGDVGGMLACVSPKIVHDTNQGSRRTGREAFAAFCHHMQKCYRERLTDVAVMASADGRRAAAEFVVHGTYLAADPDMPPAHGQTYVLPAGTFFAIEDDLITRVTTYYNLQDWIAQVSGKAKAG